jgi:spermidine/putrescine transport system substrate-binding protein
MTDGRHDSGISRREFLRNGGAAALGLALLGVGCSKGGSSSSSLGTTEAPKAQIDGDLNYFNWAQYLDPKLISDFEKQYGVKVHQSNFHNMAGMLAKLRAGVSYDIIWPEAFVIHPLIESGLLQPIDHSQLKNSKYILPYFQQPWYDPSSAHTVPYAFWTTGIAWREDLLGALTGSWNDLWNTPKADGNITLLDDMRESIGMSLLLQGNDLNSTDPSQLTSAADQLIQLKPKLRQITADDIPTIRGGDATMVHAWSGDVYVALTTMRDPGGWKYQTCQEGVVVGSDCMAIPSNAQHPGTAMLFIDWMLDQTHTAQNVGYFGYPMGNSGGQQAFANLVKDYPWLDVTTDMLDHGLQIHDLAPASLQTWTQDWAKVKA